MSNFNLHVRAWLIFFRSPHSFIHPERNLVRSPRFPQPRPRDTWIWMDLCSNAIAQREMVSLIIWLQNKLDIFKKHSLWLVFLCFSPLFWFSDDSDSDSELSVDEHSSSYASSQSSDSEDDDIDAKPKWNNERHPVHSTPKGMQMTFLGML